MFTALSEQDNGKSASRNKCTVLTFGQLKAKQSQQILFKNIFEK